MNNLIYLLLEYLFCHPFACQDGIGPEARAGEPEAGRATAERALFGRAGFRLKNSIPVKI
jgi:hypothetical protein